MGALDESTYFDDRPIYRQQRLLNNSDGDWFIIWYDEKDSFVINDYVPDGYHYVVYYESICDEDVTKPNNCSQPWSFYGGYGDVIGNLSKAKLFSVASNDESVCIQQPMDT